MVVDDKEEAELLRRAAVIGPDMSPLVVQIISDAREVCRLQEVHDSDRLNSQVKIGEVIATLRKSLRKAGLYGPV